MCIERERQTDRQSEREKDRESARPRERETERDDELCNTLVYCREYNAEEQQLQKSIMQRSNSCNTCDGTSDAHAHSRLATYWQHMYHMGSIQQHT